MNKVIKLAALAAAFLSFAACEKRMTTMYQ